MHSTFKLHAKKAGFFLTNFPPSLLSFRISYCTADKTQDKVFAYVSQSQFNETLECHAFLCQKKKIVSENTSSPQSSLPVKKLCQGIGSLGC